MDFIKDKEYMLCGKECKGANVAQTFNKITQKIVPFL